MYILSVKGPNKQSQSIVFKPKVKAGMFYKNQDIHASLSRKLIDESHVKFDSEVSTNNAPLEINIPFNKNTLEVKLTKRKDKDSKIVGVQVLDGTHVKTSQQFRGKVEIPLTSPIQI